MKISFVIAVYHNEGAISKTHEKIQSVFFNELMNHDYEIIFVDGSVPFCVGDLTAIY